MTRPDLDAIRARCEAATPGPWTPESEQGHGRNVRAIASVAWCPVACAIGKESQSIGQRDASRNARFIAHARTDIPALLAYIDELERDLLNERATFESCNRARQHCEHECATLKARTTYTVGETEWAHRIATLEHMLGEERENVDTLRAAVEHAEQRFVDEYDARKAAEREIAELKARITTLESMKP